MNKPELIILVDDDEINNFINETILKDIFPNTKIIAFVNPMNALHFILAEYIEKPVPSIIFLDINMPQMSGWEFLHQLEKIHENIVSKVHFFILSSSVDSTDKAKSISNILVKDFLTKPLSKRLIQNLFQS